MTEVRWTEQAIDNLAAIKAFIGQDSPAYALAVVGRRYQAVGQLAQFPDSWRKVREQNRPEIREPIRPPYRIVYRRRPELVEVLLVFRSSLPLPGSRSEGALSDRALQRPESLGCHTHR